MKKGEREMKEENIRERRTERKRKTHTHTQRRGDRDD